LQSTPTFGIGQRQSVLIDQHHRREARDRLHHRVKRKHGVRGHRPFGGDIADAEALEINRPSVLPNQNDRTGKLSS
jgi:hypothetical protein